MIPITLPIINTVDCVRVRKLRHRAFPLAITRFALSNDTRRFGARGDVGDGGPSSFACSREFERIDRVSRGSGVARRDGANGPKYPFHSISSRVSERARRRASSRAPPRAVASPRAASSDAVGAPP
tara:strand:+ start:673 stop:1050 length:378 start_codon:yes stop_codon:yes gene_type:complete